MAEIETNRGEDSGAAPEPRDLPEPAARPSLDAWAQAAAKEVKGKDLTWHTPEGIAVKPLYTEADVAGDARMVAVIAAMGGEIEGDRKPLLPSGEITAVEGVGFLGGGEARILANGPGPPGIHGRAHPPREGGKARQARIDRHVLSRVERLDGDPFRGRPGQILALHFLGGSGSPLIQRRLVGHRSIYPAPSPLRGRIRRLVSLSD